jgi:hypothetical protein
MAQPPVPRPSSLTPAVPGATTRRRPGAIDYAPADAVGFERLPPAVANALASVLLGPPVAADADEPVAKRRRDGTYYQQATGWWTGGDRYVTVDARRLLAPAEGQSLKPVTGWKIEGTIAHFPQTVLPVNSQWRFNPDESATAGKRARPKTDDPLDVLPEQLTAPLREAQASAWREGGRGWAQETIVAALAINGRVRVLKAQRKATSLRALETADWHAVTLDTSIVSFQPLNTDPATGQVLVGPATSAAQLPPGSTPTNSIEPTR